MLEVDFITLGDASKRIDVPSPTLRHWTDQLEEYRVHYVKRNNRNERIYEESDLRIFMFLRDLKSEYGRRTTTEDLAYMIAEKGEEGVFELRKEDEFPTPVRSNKTADLLGQEDIKRLMESDRVKQFMSIVVSETTKNIRDEMKAEMDTLNKKILESHEFIEKELKEQRAFQEQQEEMAKKRDEMLMETLRNTIEAKNNKGFFAKLFGK